MPRFSLITQLDTDHREQEAKDPNAPNITYQQYNFDVSGIERGVLIPVRECEKFEVRASGIERLSDQKLNQIVREFRGLFVRD